MIDPYEFDNANVDGDKEAVIVPNPPTLVNKLSANETNGIKDKINELVDIVNTITPILYPELRLLFKADGNVLPGLQVGDIVHGFADATTVWSKAIYEGGDVTDRANYTPIIDGISEPQLFTSTGSSNDFTLTDGKIAQNVFLDRGMRYKTTEWTQAGAVVSLIGATLAAGRKIYIT